MAQRTIITCAASKNCKEEVAKEQRWILSGQGSGLTGARVQPRDRSVALLTRVTAPDSVVTLSFDAARDWLQRVSREMDAVDAAERAAIAAEGADA